jgi:nucleoside-diphosphate-sugar epimerase
MNKRILIIGSQGYLGSRLSDYLFANGYDCTGLDTGFFQYGVLYRPKKLDMLEKDARTISEHDLEGYDVVVQLAAVANDPFENLPIEAIYDPVRKYTIDIARLCKKLGVRYLFPSSCAVYGIGQGELDEDGPTNPQSPYSINKLQVEQDLTRLADASFSPIALRLATVFGTSPRIRFDVVINMLCGMAVTQREVVLNSDGQAWRPHLDIEDACEAFRCCIDWDYDGGSLLVLNVGRNDNNWKIIDLARLIQLKVDGCELRYLNASSDDGANDLVKDRNILDGVDKRTYQVRFDRIAETLPGFVAQWDVARGIDRLLSELKLWCLNEGKFKQRDFYRLQQMEFLYHTQQIDDRLNWSR